MPQLERLSKENPSYYYDVILYAMVFGLSEIWTKKFNTIPLAQLDWYDSYYSDINVNLKMYSFDHLRMYNIDHINTFCSRR